MTQSRPAGGRLLLLVPAAAALLLAGLLAAPSSQAVVRPAVPTPAAGPLADPAVLAAASVAGGEGGAVAAVVPGDGRRGIARPRGVAPGSGAETVARAFVASLGSVYGVGGGAADLRLDDVTSLDGGDRAVRFQQLVGGVPVYGGELVVQLGRGDSLVSVTGETTHVSGALTFGVAAERARSVALAAASRVVGAGAPRLVTSAAAPFVYDPALVDGKGGTVRPVWRVVVSGPPAGGDVVEVLVDAGTGAVVARNDHSAHLARSICDNENDPSSNLARGSFCTATDYNGYYLTTIDATRPQAERAYRDLGDVADFYQDVLGVDLTRLVGLDTTHPYSQRSDPVLTATVNYCEAGSHCPYANAFWSDSIPDYTPGRGKVYPGGQVYLGKGLADSEDVVAHEVSHGVTAATNGLKYENQSGAINESMSDVFGELSQLYDHSTRSFEPSRDPKWLIGENLDVPGLRGAVRSMSNPSTTSLAAGDPQPNRMTSKYWDASGSDGGGVHANNGVGNKTAYLIAHGATFNGTRVRGIGARATARIYWRTENLLTSGANYRDLAVTLAIACTALYGRTSSTCASVRAATKATEISVSRVKISMHSSKVAYGKGRTIRARLVSARGSGMYVRTSQGVRLVLEKRYLHSKHWKRVGKRRVTTAGRASWTVHPKRSAVYRVKYAGSKSLGLGSAKATHILTVHH